MVVSVCQWKLFYSGAYEHVVFGQFILQLYTACGFTNGTGGFFSPEKREGWKVSKWNQEPKSYKQLILGPYS